MKAKINTRVPPRLLLFFLVLAIWILGHPFDGLTHDARLYGVQALHYLYPERYGQDLFFLYGSQDDFTLFTPIYATLIDFLGMHTAMILLLAVSYTLWTGAAALLAGKMVQGFQFWLAIVLIFAIPGYYATDTLFRYGEPFLTPRIIAEALTLLSLALLLKKKRLIPLTLLFTSMVLHPLMAMAGIGFTAFYLLKDHPKTVLVVAAMGTTLVLLLAFLQITPFDRLLIAMDKEWFELCFIRSPFIFWDGWKIADWNRVVFAFSLLLMACSAAPGDLRRVFLSALAIGGVGVALFWIGTSLTHTLLLIQLQPYRFLWLTHFFALISAAWLIGKFWNKGQTYRLLLLNFLTAWLLLDYAGGGLAVVLCTLFIRRTRSNKEITIPDAVTRLLSGLPLAALAWWLLKSWQATAEIFPETTNFGTISIDFALAWGILLLRTDGGILAIPCFLTIWRYGSDQRKGVSLSITGGVLLLLELSIVPWILQNKWNQLYLHQILLDPIPAFRRLIPENAAIYWEEDLKMTWFVLGRASYASHYQLAGLMFNRQTCIEGKRRMDRLAPLNTKDSIFVRHIFARQFPKSRNNDQPRPSFKALIHACYDPALDFVVLSSKFEEGVIAQHFEQVTEKNFYLYDCTTLRRDFADTWESQ